MRTMVVNAPLCFLLSKWGRLPPADLKELSVGFYTCEQIFASKEILHANIVALKMDGIPQLKIRRISKGTAEMRDRKEIEDLLTLISFADENKIFNLLDKFVVDSADDIPSPRVCDTDFIAIIRKLNAIESHCNDLQAKLDKAMDVSRATTVAVEKLTVSKEPFPNLPRGGGWEQ